MEVEVRRRCIVKKVVKPTQKRQVMGHLKQAHGLNLSRCCALIGLPRSTAYYTGTRPNDQGIRERLKELAKQNRRYGYLRIHYLLRKEGLILNRKRTWRLYREEGLQVYKRKGRKRFKGERVPLSSAERVNQRWSLDCHVGQLVHGPSFPGAHCGG